MQIAYCTAELKPVQCGSSMFVCHLEPSCCRSVSVRILRNVIAAFKPAFTLSSLQMPVTGHHSVGWHSQWHSFLLGCTVSHNPSSHGRPQFWLCFVPDQQSSFVGGPRVLDSLDDWRSVVQLVSSSTWSAGPDFCYCHNSRGFVDVSHHLWRRLVWHLLQT